MSPARSTESEDADWWDVAEDPDPSEDLDYELIDLDVIRTETGGKEQVLLLPSDEDMLRRDAFIVAERDAVCDLETMV